MCDLRKALHCLASEISW